MFRTAIGFHDAYVAAPSQKAALEAWGADSNLFAQGIAEQVSNPELMKAPVERPGEVIRVLRGSAEEQVRALGDTNRQQDDRPSPRSRSRASRPSPAKREREKKRLPRPSRGVLDRAEQALKEAEREQGAAMAALRQEERALQERRRKLEEKQARELERLAAAADKARQMYRDAMARWAEQL